MVSLATFRNLALSFPQTEVMDQFEKSSFRIRKKIFAILWLKEKRVIVNLSHTDQSVFCSFDKTIIYPVNGGAWGKKGWTMIELSKIKKAMLKDALATAWCLVAPKKLSIIYLEDSKNRV